METIRLNTVPVRFGYNVVPKTGFKAIFRMATLGTLAAFSGGCANLGQTLNGMLSRDRFQRNVLTYHNPEKAEGYNDKNPQHYGYSFSLSLTRAEFNRTTNLDLLNEFLPYRRHLQQRAITNPAEAQRLSQLDQAIHNLANHQDAQFWFADKHLKLYPMDKSTRYLIAARLLEVYHNRMDVVERTLKQDKPFRIVMFEDLKQTIIFKDEDIGGYFPIGTGDIELDKNAFWQGVNYQGDGYAVAIHEFSHAVDSAHIPVLGINLPDGLLQELSAKDQATFKKERNRMTQLHKENSSSFTGHIKYAFKNHWEFLPTTIEQFYETPEALKAKSPALYDVYKRYFLLDPANDYRDLPHPKPPLKKL